MRSGLKSPFIVLMIGLSIIAILLARTEERTSAVERAQSYPPARTAVPTTTGRQYPAPTTPTTNAAPTVAVIPTIATTPTRAITTSTPAIVPAVTATAEPTPTLEPVQPSPIPTQAPIVLTPTPPPALLMCIPGTPMQITGTGTPLTPILLYFGQRIVGGGSIDSDGRFSIPLVVGEERNGNYVVRVKVRGSPEIIHELTCTVPAITPTALPRLRYR